MKEKINILTPEEWFESKNLYGSTITEGLYMLNRPIYFNRPPRYIPVVKDYKTGNYMFITKSKDTMPQPIEQQNHPEDCDENREMTEGEAEIAKGLDDFFDAKEQQKEEEREKIMQGFPSLPQGFTPTTLELLVFSIEDLKKFVIVNPERFGYAIKEIRGLLKMALESQRQSAGEEERNDILGKLERFGGFCEKCKDRFKDIITKKESAPQE